MSVNKYNSATGELERIAGGTLYADLPIGSWVKNDSNTVPSGFLKAGDTIDPTLYPELYAMYGSTVPYKADTSQLSVYENINLSSQVTMQYDGFLSVTALGNKRYIVVNNVTVSTASPVSDIDGSGFIAFRKGDVVKLSDYYNGCAKVAYYKKSLIVKAKQVAIPFDMAEYIRNQNVLSEWEDITIPSSDATAITMQYDGYIFFNMALPSDGQYHYIYINGVDFHIGAISSISGGGDTSNCLPFKKDDVIYGESLRDSKVAYYKLRDYTGR